jgi:hypothetical protein
MKMFFELRASWLFFKTFTLVSFFLLFHDTEVSTQTIVKIN